MRFKVGRSVCASARLGLWTNNDLWHSYSCENSKDLLKTIDGTLIINKRHWPVVYELFVFQTTKFQDVYKKNVTWRKSYNWRLDITRVDYKLTTQITSYTPNLIISSLFLIIKRSKNNITYKISQTCKILINNLSLIIINTGVMFFSEKSFVENPNYLFLYTWCGFEIKLSKRPFYF